MRLLERAVVMQQSKRTVAACYTIMTDGVVCRISGIHDRCPRQSEAIEIVNTERENIDALRADL